MEYVRQYQNRINWQNEPSFATPINETNLNKIDKALNYIDEKLSEAVDGGIAKANPSETPTESLNKIEINGIVYGVSGGGGGSYTAGSGIDITNNVIANTRKGALSGVIDEITSGGYAHTQINNALDSITAGGLVVLKAEASGTANTVRIQYGEQASQSQAYRLCDTDLEYATINVSVGDTIILMFDTTGYKLIVLSVLNNSGGSGGDSYAGLGIGKMTSFTNNVIDTDIDLHRAPIVGDRLLIYFDAKVTNPTGLITYNNGTAITGNLESVTPLYINEGWNILEFKNDGLLYVNAWVRVQNVAVSNSLFLLSDTQISSPTDGQVLTYDDTSNMWKNESLPTVQANTGTATNYLNKLKVGNYTYDASAIRPYTATSITSSSVDSGTIGLTVPNTDAIHGDTIAINTGSHSGTTVGAWYLGLHSGGTYVPVEVQNADGTDFTDELTANMLIIVSIDSSNDVATVLKIAGASGGGASALTDLTDTNITSPTDGQVLIYNGTTGKWENKPKEVYFEQSVTLSTSQTTTVTFSNAAFTANSVVDPAISVWGIFPEDVTVASGSCTVVMPKVSTAQTITVGIFIKR